MAFPQVPKDLFQSLGLEELSMTIWINLTFLAGVLIWWTYNLFFHPLASYPGPFLARVSWIYHAIHTYRGTLAENTKRLHDRYGEVVRIAPNILSLNDGQAWEDIYGRGHGNAYAFVKDPGKEFRLPNSPPSIGFAPEKDHRRYRRILSYAFSEKSITEHEPLVLKHVDSLMSSLHQQVNLSQGSFINIEKSMTAIMFDLTTDLSFGQSFGSVNSPNISHPWMSLVTSSLKGVSVYCAMRRLLPHGLWPFVDQIMGKAPSGSKIEALNFAKQVVGKRLQNVVDHNDFMTYMIESHGVPDGLSRREIERLALSLVIAGSDTTSTLLCNTIYRLSQHPQVLQELLQQIQETAPSSSEITFSAVKKMPYLTAVLEECLRMLPPVPNVFPRVVPREGVTICGHFVPGGSIVGVSQLSANMSSKHFSQPAEFLPTRWLGREEFHHDNRRARKPFSYGPRNCAGQNAAYMHSKIIIARLVSEFDISLDPTCLDWPQRCKSYDTVEKPPLYLKLFPRPNGTEK
ncbi:hypothetical protein NUU61_009292 [Penicillium alfredii]|uniref:Cytochrome P450 n=1 Tax=Penicillium alfredii TaxID=1506179 RepID=A0A9W9EMR6_9EURO|nr:uncharacterized protein NUU61_009292 [Penicillium alfredii]KAJ5084713.1 hypothetical protein NUU61_009292 [Penicillium alfredii]